MSDVRRGRVLQFDDSLSLSSKWSWAVRTTSTVTKRRRWPTSWRGSIVTRWPTSRWTTTRTGDASQSLFTSKHHDSHRSHTVSSFFQCFYDLCWQRFKTSCFQSCCGTWRQRVHFFLKWRLCRYSRRTFINVGVTCTKCTLVFLQNPPKSSSAGK